MLELSDYSSEDSLAGGQLSAAEEMAEVEGDPCSAAVFLDHVLTLEEESSSKDDRVEEVLDRLDAKVRDKITCLEQDTLRSKDEMIEGLGVAHQRAETSSNEFVTEDLKQEHCRLEEENQLLRGSSSESRYPVYNVLQENALEEVVSNISDLENQEDPRLELVAELKSLKAHMQVAHNIHARLESETVARRQEKEDEVRRVSSQIMILERQLHVLEEEPISVLVRSNDIKTDSEMIDDEKIKLKDQLTSILDDRQKFEVELVGMLRTCQEQVRTVEVEQQNLLSTNETLNTVAHQLEGLNAAMSSEFEPRRHSAEGELANLASELQISQDREHNLQLQSQDLREENTVVVIEASKLDQEVDELKSDMLRLSSDLERLVLDRERKEELEAELRTYKEHVQSLEAEKLASVTLVDNLMSQVRELEEDKRHLTGLSNEASQSMQHLWEENTRLIDGYNRLEQEKQAHEGERMELVGGIQTVWEQLHVANEREQLLASDLRGLNDRRDAEEVLFDQKLKDLELKLEALEQEKSDLVSRSEETVQVLEVLIQETSQKAQHLQEERDQVVHEVSELVSQKEATEQAVSVQQISWETQVQGLESEKSVILFTVEGLVQQLHTSTEEVQDLKEKDENSNLLVFELRGEISRLSGEIDKLEEVKERQEGERLELAADLQAAWDQIQAVRDSEATVATELSELKELRNIEKLRSDGLVQDLRRQLEELEERTSEAGITVDHLSKRLHELRKEQELQDENERLGAEIAILFQEKDMILTEKTVLLGKVQTLQGRVEGLELDKNKMAFDIEELNQWLQGPAAEKKQLVANLDEMTRLLKGFELERTQLTTSVSELLEEKERMLKDVGKLQGMISVLEEEQAKLLSAHEDAIRQLEFLEEEKRQALRIQEDSTRLVLHLSEKIDVLEGELTRITSVHEDSLLRIEFLEEGKIIMERLLEEQCLDLNQLRHVNIEHGDAFDKFERLLEHTQREVQLLTTQVSSSKEENSRMKTLHDTVHAQLQALETGKSQAENIIISLGEERSQLLQSLEESELRMQGLITRNSDLSDTVSSLEAELMTRSEEIQMMRGHLPGMEEDASNLSVNEFQLENVEHANRMKLVEEEVALRPAEVQRVEKRSGSLSLGHQISLFQLEVLKEGKDEFDGLNLSIQELHVKNRQHMSRTEILEDKVVRRQVEVQRLEDHTESLSTVNQTTFLQLQVLNEEKDLLAKVLDVPNLSAQKFQVANSELATSMNSPDEKTKRRQAEMQDSEKEMECLATTRQDTVLQLQTLEQKKVELLKCLDASCSSFQELRGWNAEFPERKKFLDEEVAQMRADMLSLELETESLSTAHDDSPLQLQQLAAEKSASINQLLECQDLIQELHTEDSELVKGVRKFQEELFRRQEKVESLVFPVYSLDDKDFRGASEYHGVPFHVHLLGVAEVAGSIKGCAEPVGQVLNGDTSMKLKCSVPELTVKKLEMENVELFTTVSKLKKHLHEETQIFKDQVQSSEVGRERFGPEGNAKILWSEQKRIELAKALEDSAVADNQIKFNYLKASVLDLGRGKDELANQLKLVQEQTSVVVAERDQLSSEMQVVREQLQGYVEKLEESENVAKRSKDEAVALANQLENFREQVSKQVGCTPMRNGDLVTELELVLDRERMSFGQMEISHLTGANIDPREELQQASLGWVEIITTVCQELAKLLRSVGEEKEKLARKQGMSHQKTKVLTNLCQELDRLILNVREKTERFAEELTFLKQKLVKSQNERLPPESDSDLNLGNWQQLPTLVAPEKQESILEVETACQTLQSTQAERTVLEAHVANLSSCLADYQGQLKALVIKSSSENPYLLTSRADDGGYRKGLACFSADDDGVLNSGSELKEGRNIKALDQEKKEKEGNTTLTLFTQRTQTPGRSFKRCKVSMQQPKRRWIF